MNDRNMKILECALLLSMQYGEEEQRAEKNNEETKSIWLQYNSDALRSFSEPNCIPDTFFYIRLSAI